MTDETEVLERDEQISEPMSARPTKRELAERGLKALNPKERGTAAVSMNAGCVSFAKFEEVMNFATAIATAGVLLPKYLQNNPGACLGLTIQAIEWRMSPVGVMQKSYEVNGRVGYESQLIHAVVESRAGLQHRLDCRYDGEGPTRSCTVIGMFTSGDIREYTSPMLKDIRVKNSPLWKDDPDQQLFYYASRSWARKWVPEVLMGIYSREELVTQPDIGREGEDMASPGLHARLIGSPRSDDGHTPGHVERELETVAGAAINAPTEAQEQIAVADAQEPVKQAKKRGRPRKIQETEPSNVVAIPVIPTKDNPYPVPTTVAEYIQHAKTMIAELETVEELELWWRDEMKLRNKLGVTGDDRAPLMQLIAERREGLA